MCVQVLLLERVYTLLRRTPRLRPRTQVDIGIALDDPISFKREREAWQRDVAATASKEGVLFADLQRSDPAAAKGGWASCVDMMLMVCWH